MSALSATHINFWSLEDFFDLLDVSVGGRFHQLFADISRYVRFKELLQKSTQSLYKMQQNNSRYTHLQCTSQYMQYGSQISVRHKIYSDAVTSGRATADDRSIGRRHLGHGGWIIGPRCATDLHLQVIVMVDLLNSSNLTKSLLQQTQPLEKPVTILKIISSTAYY